ncbi:hypothetical protein H2198_001428 [Neophaeococcomyces mojaviensis]|uniref:Uncharacterized protein n=1 Tax=Neophaeococcomyces mojaviensis TaxID=3383035 RepID=A0ACC3AGU9_9EURO|nr:hypothetical protein H2198_001428 [Knufia sp. JES_112]
MTAVSTATVVDRTTTDQPMDAVRIIENINATVAARYTLANPVYVPSAVSSLCLACKAIFDVSNTVPSLQTLSQNGRRPGEVVHQSLDNVAEAAKRGCHLCITVYMHLDPAALRAFRRYINASIGRESPDSTAGRLNSGFASIHPIARDQARLNFRWVACPEAASPSDKGKMGLLRGNSFEPYANKNDSRVTLSSEASFNQGRMDSELSVELILMNPIYAVEPGVRTISAKSTSTASDECFEIARQWLDDCSFNHMKCSANEAAGPIQKPTYLLDVTIKGPKGVPGVKLVDGQFLDPFTEYVTLSHCWGISRDPNMKRIRLHKKTLGALRQGVASSSLPKTFAEAAIATAKLGYRYLWIDALCIMHDNEKSVLEEVANMHRTYGEATLNLAATGAPDDSTGLFFSRNALALQPATVEVGEGFGISGGSYKVLRSTIWEDLVDASPLAQRAWVFQERALSKRTLHFARNEILWECQQMCCSEVFPKGLPVTMKNMSDQERRQNGIGPASPVSEKSFNFTVPKATFNKRTHHQRTTNWHSLVEAYTEGRQTYTSDKLLGISGLARQYLSRNRLKPSDYAVGLWRPTLPHSLLWRIHDSVGKRPPKYRAPSWTWASIDGRVSVPAPSQASKQTCLEVIEVDVQHKNNDPLGLCEYGRIKVRGFMGKGSLRRTRDFWGHCSFNLVPMNRMIGEVKFENAWFDERLPKLSDEGAGIMIETLEIYILPVIDVMERVEGLILCATMKKGEFRRLGIFEICNGTGQAALGMSPEVRGPTQDNWDRFKSVMKGDPEMMNFEERLDHENAYWFASDYTYTINIL